MSSILLLLWLFDGVVIVTMGLIPLAVILVGRLRRR
jgi:hypothetical protein